MDEPELGVVDELPLLAFLDALDGEPHLLFELVVGSVVEVGDAGVDADDGLDGGEGVFAGRGGVVDEGLGDFDVFGESGDEVDVAFTVSVDGGLEFAVLLDGPAEVFGEAGLLCEECVEILAGEGEEDAGSDGADGDVGGLVGDDVGLAEELSVGEQRDAEVGSVGSLAQDLDLSLGEDEEGVAVLAFADERVAEGDLLGLEACGHAADDAVGQPREERHAAEALGREDGARAGEAAGEVDADPSGPRQFHLGAVDPVGAPLDLHEGQKPQEPPRRDRHHHRRRLRRRRQIAGHRRRHAPLQNVVAHGIILDGLVEGTC